MTLTQQYFFGQGKVSICTRNADGTRNIVSDALDVSELSVSPSETEVVHKEHRTGRMLTDESVVFQPEVAMSIVFDNLDAENLSRFYKGTVSTVASGSVTGESHSLGSDKILYTLETNVDPATVVVTETAPGPSAPIAAGSLDIDKSGRIVIAQGEAATAVDVDYDYGTSQSISAYTGNQNEDFWLLYDGINLGDNDNRVLVDLYKVKFVQEGEHSFIGEEFTNLGMNGMVLFDSQQPDDPVTGQFMRIRYYDK